MKSGKAIDEASYGFRNSHVVSALVCEARYRGSNLIATTEICFEISAVNAPDSQFSQNEYIDYGQCIRSS